MTRGPVYDNAVRLLASTDLVALCHWLGIDATAESIRVSEALPAATLYADLLVRAGPGRLEHVEFVRAPTGDLLDRMLEYRARILRREPGSLIRQHVLVLAEGRVPRALTDRLTPLDVHITYLRDENPATFLADPSLAPLATLARPAPGRHRTDLLRQALTVIATVPDPARRQELAGTAAVLAGIHLDALTIEQISQEARMSFTLEDTVAGRQLVARGEARGEARGRAHGQADLLAALLRRTFSDDPRIPDLAARLARRPHGEALDAVLGATTLDDLL